jgi:hypothetical protein
MAVWLKAVLPPAAPWMSFQSLSRPALSPVFMLETSVQPPPSVVMSHVTVRDSPAGLMRNSPSWADGQRALMLAQEMPSGAAASGDAHAGSAAVVGVVVAARNSAVMFAWAAAASNNSRSWTRFLASIASRRSLMSDTSSPRAVSESFVARVFV